MHDPFKVTNYSFRSCFIFILYMLSVFYLFCIESIQYTNNQATIWSKVQKIGHLGAGSCVQTAENHKHREKEFKHHWTWTKFSTCLVKELLADPEWGKCNCFSCVPHPSGMFFIMVSAKCSDIRILALSPTVGCRVAFCGASSCDLSWGWLSATFNWMRPGSRQSATAVPWSLSSRWHHFQRFALDLIHMWRVSVWCLCWLVRCPVSAQDCKIKEHEQSTKNTRTGQVFIVVLSCCLNLQSVACTCQNRSTSLCKNLWT